MNEGLPYTKKEAENEAIPIRKLVEGLSDGRKTTPDDYDFAHAIVEREKREEYEMVKRNITSYEINIESTSDTNFDYDDIAKLASVIENFSDRDITCEKINRDKNGRIFSAEYILDSEISYALFQKQISYLFLTPFQNRKYDVPDNVKVPTLFRVFGDKIWEDLEKKSQTHSLTPAEEEILQEHQYGVKIAEYIEGEWVAIPNA